MAADVFDIWIDLVIRTRKWQITFKDIKEFDAEQIFD